MHFFFVLNSCIIFLGFHESSWSCSKNRVSVESGCSSVCPVTSPCSLSSLSARGGKGRSGALRRGAGARKARLVDVCNGEFSALGWVRSPRTMERRGMRKGPEHGGDSRKWMRKQSRSCQEENKGHHPGEPRGGDLRKAVCPTEAVMRDLFGSLREKRRQSKEDRMRRGEG